MKKITFIVIAFLNIIYNITNAQTTRDEAFELLKNKVITKTLDSLEIYANKTILAENTEVKSYNNMILKTLDTSWMFFIDEQPFENWSHACKYVFINIKGEIQIVEANMFPTFPSMSDLEIVNTPTAFIKKSGPLTPFQTPSPTQKSIQPRSANKMYALIISGGVDPSNNHERFWNDCSSIYTTLVKKYFYSPSDIYVLMSDGTNPGTDLRRIDGTFISSPLDLDGDEKSDIKYAATKENLTSVLSELEEKITQNDLLFIYTMDHGGLDSENEAILYLWGDARECILASEFASLVNKINAKAINIVMGQCYSGGFVDYFKNNPKVSIATACAKEESSYAMKNLLYDEFVYYWTEAYNQTISSHANFMSSQSAFIYAKNRDTQPETPQFYASDFNRTSVSINDVRTEISGYVNYNGNSSSHTKRTFDGSIGSIPAKAPYPVEIGIDYPKAPLAENWSASNPEYIRVTSTSGGVYRFDINGSPKRPFYITLNMPNYDIISFTFVPSTSKSYKVALGESGTALKVETEETDVTRSVSSESPIYEIYNINGIMVTTGRLSEKVNYINTSSFYKGIYIINIHQGNEKFESKFTIT